MRDCAFCKGDGEVWYTACPMKSVEPRIWHVLEMADFARKGSWPVAGGVLDQAASFVAAASTAWAEDDRCRAALRVPRKNED